MRIPKGYNAVFVYGTLKNQQKADDYSIKGRLFDIGHFPGIVLEEHKEIPGQIALVSDKRLASLDRYEGVPNLYTREKTLAQPLNGAGGAVDVWVYQWAGNTDDYKEIDKW